MLFASLTVFMMPKIIPLSSTSEIFASGSLLYADHYWNSVNDIPRLLAYSSVHSSMSAGGDGVSPSGRRMSDNASRGQITAHNPHPMHRTLSTSHPLSGRESALK